MNIHHFDTIDSTNDYCLAYHRAHPDEVILCTADRQTKGRGRQGKAWSSDEADNVYLSYCRPLKVEEPSGALSLVVGAVVAAYLKELGVTEVGLKWPNDIWVDHNKIAGILIEGPVIGIGLNCVQPKGMTSQGVTCLTDHIISYPEKDEIALSLALAIEKALPEYEQAGLQPFLQIIKTLDVLKDQPITWDTGQARGESIALGIDESGALLIQDAPFRLNSATVRCKTAKNSL